MKEFERKDYLEMFYKPLAFSYLIYNNNREDKGDSWQDEEITSMSFLREKLLKEVTEYLFAPQEKRYLEICDVINMALMLGCRELEIAKNRVGIFEDPTPF